MRVIDFIYYILFYKFCFKKNLNLLFLEIINLGQKFLSLNLLIPKFLGFLIIIILIYQ